jgi:hypothetical protein
MRERDALLTDKNNLTQQLLAMTAQVDLLAAMQAQNEHLNAEVVAQSQELSQLRIQQVQTDSVLTKLKQEFALLQTQAESDKANLKQDFAVVQQQNVQLLQQQRDMTATATRQLHQAEADKLTSTQLQSKLVAADNEVARLTRELENTVQSVLIKSQGMMLLQDRISELEHELLEMDKQDRATTVTINPSEDSARRPTASSAVVRPAPPPPPGPPPQFAIQAGERLGTLRPDMLVMAAAATAVNPAVSVAASESDATSSLSPVPAMDPTSQAVHVTSSTTETPSTSTATVSHLVAAATSRYFHAHDVKARCATTTPSSPDWCGVCVVCGLLEMT